MSRSKYFCTPFHGSCVHGHCFVYTMVYAYSKLKALMLRYFDYQSAIFFNFRTTGDGNCLFNACSISLCGNESLSSSLRILTAIELFVNAQFYANHPCLLLEWESSGNLFRSKKSIFASCLSDESFELLNSQYSNRKECIKNEALLFSKPAHWS